MNVQATDIRFCPASLPKKTGLVVLRFKNTGRGAAPSAPYRTGKLTYCYMAAQGDTRLAANVTSADRTVAKLGGGHKYDTMSATEAAMWKRINTATATYTGDGDGSVTTGHYFNTFVGFVLGA